MVVVPSAQSLTIVISIKLGVLVSVAVFVMALAMSLSLCERDAAAGKKYRCCDRSNPFSNFHENSYVTRRMVRRSEEHTSELQSHLNLVCRLLLEKKKTRYHGLL